MMKTEEAISILEQLFDCADEMHENTNGDIIYWNQMKAIEKAIESLKKENANKKTIEELLKINSELAADNNNITKARRKIMELEMRVNRLVKERDKYQTKLIHRDEHFKEIIKESIMELIEERIRR